MFAHCAVGATSLPKATSLGEADITCTQGQTSFGDLLYRRSPFAFPFIHGICFANESISAREVRTRWYPFFREAFLFDCRGRRTRRPVTVMGELMHIFCRERGIIRCFCGRPMVAPTMVGECLGAPALRKVFCQNGTPRTSSPTVSCFAWWKSGLPRTSSPTVAFFFFFCFFCFFIKFSGWEKRGKLP